MDTDHVVGTFRVDICNAIKISIDRPVSSASAVERDAFGAQQQADFILMSFPAHADPAESNAVV